MLTFELFKIHHLWCALELFFSSLFRLSISRTPCVDSKRFRVYIQNVSVCAGTTSKKREMDRSVSGEVAASRGSFVKYAELWFCGFVVFVLTLLS